MWNAFLVRFCIIFFFKLLSIPIRGIMHNKHFHNNHWIIDKCRFEKNTVSNCLSSLQLFDFDVEVQPVLQVLVGKTIEQALLEVMEEEELDNLRARHRAFMEVRNAELVEVQRLEERERRLRVERVRITLSPIYSGHLVDVWIGTVVWYMCFLYISIVFS